MPYRQYRPCQHIGHSSVTSSVVIVGTVHVARHSLLDMEIGGKSRPRDGHDIDDQRKGLPRIVTFFYQVFSIDNQIDNQISDPHNRKA